MPVLPARGLDDEHPRTQPPLLDGVVDHRGADPVLHRVEGVVALVLDRDPARQPLPQPVEPDQWGVADGLGDVLVDLPVGHGDLVRGNRFGKDNTPASVLKRVEDCVRSPRCEHSRMRDSSAPLRARCLGR